MAARIEFGQVKSLEEPKDDNEDFTMAVIVPDDDSGSITRKLYIPWYWRRRFGNIEVGDKVLYALSSCDDGAIISRTNGEWDGVVRNDNTLIQFNGNTQVDKNTLIKGNSAVQGNSLVEGNADIIGNLSADSNVSLSTGIEISGGTTKLGGTLSVGGAKPFVLNPYCSHAIVDTGTDSISTSALAGGKANSNKGSYYEEET